MWNYFRCTQMSEAQNTYIKYFDQILVNSFVPMSRPLILSKIVLVNESPDIISDQKEQALLNPDDFAKNLFFKIKSGSEVIYD
jgi:hypothetical protein